MLGSGSSGIVLANYSTSFSLLTSSLQDFHECVKGNNNYYTFQFIILFYNISNIITNYMGIPVKVTPTPKMLFLSRKIKNIITLCYYSSLSQYYRCISSPKYP